MKNIWIIFFYLVFSLSLSYADSFPKNKFIKAKLLKIIDGDTFLIFVNNRKEKIRLLWIDTPEKYSSKKLEKQSKYCNISKKKIKKMGQLASQYAKNFFKNTKYIYVYLKKKDKYNRFLAVVLHPERKVLYNSEIIKDGFSCIYQKAYYPPVFALHLIKASLLKKGLWKDYYNIMQCLCLPLKMPKKIIKENIKNYRLKIE